MVIVVLIGNEKYFDMSTHITNKSHKNTVCCDKTYCKI